MIKEDISCEYIMHMGDDLNVVNNARVSFDKESEGARSLSDEAIILAYRAGYRADQDGTVWTPFGNTLKGWPNSTGYLNFKPAVGPRATRKSVLVHRFVAYCLYGESALAAEVVRHLNDVKTDNRFDNLCPGTYVQNRADIPAEVKSRWAKKHAHLLVERSRKLSDEDVKLMRLVRETEKTPYAKLAKRFGVSTMTAHRAVSGKSWGNVQ